jgi:hypothetical protein
MLIFETTESPGNHTLSHTTLFIRFPPYIRSYNEGAPYYTLLSTHEQWKCTLQCASHVCYTRQDLLWLTSLLSVTVNATLVLAVCESSSGRFISCAVSDICRKEPQTVFTYLFPRCEACLKVESGRFQHLLLTCGVLYFLPYMCVIWRNVRPLLFVRLGSVVSWST